LTIEHRLIVPDAELSDAVRLCNEDAHHLLNVLRMREGDKLIIADGNGREALCALTAERKAEILEVFASRGEPVSPIHLYPSLSKGDRFEWMLQKAAELGAVTVTPVMSERCVSGIPSAVKLERYRRILRSAAEQSGRGRIPELRGALSFPDAADAAKGLRVFCYEEESNITLRQIFSEGFDEISVMTGPEGGYTPEEAETAKLKGWKHVSLGNTVLRCETAPLMVLSVINYLSMDAQTQQTVRR
jgi:16S rRNA (uracil1498-N3)-methyltransferase